MGRRANFHESFDDKPPKHSTRGFCTMVATVLAAAGLWDWWNYHAYFLAWWLAALAVFEIGLHRPALVEPVSRLWMRFGELLAAVINPLVLGIIYFSTIVPMGLLVRLLRFDLLRLKPDADAASYWLVRDPPGPAPESMTNQF